jgi:transposase
MSEKRRRYDRTFREGAVRIVRETGKPVAQVARDLGIVEQTLGNWVKQDKIERGERAARGRLPGSFRVGVLVSQVATSPAPAHSE